MYGISFPITMTKDLGKQCEEDAILSARRSQSTVNGLHCSQACGMVEHCAGHRGKLFTPLPPQRHTAGDQALT